MLKTFQSDSVDWIQLAKAMFQRLLLVNIVMNLRTEITSTIVHAKKVRKTDTVEGRLRYISNYKQINKEVG